MKVNLDRWDDFPASKVKLVSKIVGLLDGLAQTVMSYFDSSVLIRPSKLMKPLSTAVDSSFHFIAA